LNESNQRGANVPRDLCLSVTRYASAAVLADHCHDQGSISIVVSGAVAEQVGEDEVEALAGDLVVKPPGTVHRNRFGPNGAVLISIANAPSSLFDRSGWRWLRQDSLVRLALAATAAARDGDPFGSGQEMAWQILEFAGADGERRVARDAPPWLATLRDEVANRPGRPSVTRLAEKAGVHPVYLSRAFRKFYGCSVSGFVRKLRVERAADLLRGTDLNVGTIAASLDFSDQSHLCRTFRKELGVAPSIYRSLLSGP
jgi:AraC family transcriptional regulator